MISLFKKNRRIGHVKGLTPLELLLGASLIAVLSSLAIITFNPIANFAESKNARRWNDTNVIAEALYHYATDHDGVFPDSLDREVPREICKSEVGGTVCASRALADLSFLVPKYIKQLPEDPLMSPDSSTGYSLLLSKEKLIVVSAPHAENGDTIVVRR